MICPHSLGHPAAFDATVVVTGEGGLAEGMAYASARMWEDWAESFARHVSGDRGADRAFQCERFGKQQWRLTACGVTALGDLGAGRRSTVLDFVLMRGCFDGHPHLRPDGRVVLREPVAGHGKLESISLAAARPGQPTEVNVANSDEVAKAVAAAFAELFKAHAPSATAPSKREQPEPDANPDGPEERPSGRDDASGVGGATAGPSPTVAATPAKSRSVRGPKALTPLEQRIVAAWESGGHKSYEAVAAALNIGPRGRRTVKKLVDRVSKQKKRKRLADN